jgi:hypothetical protein
MVHCKKLICEIPVPGEFGQNQSRNLVKIFYSVVMVSHAVKKGKKISLIYKESRKGSGAKSYMRKGFLIYEEMRKYLLIYEDAVSHI